MLSPLERVLLFQNLPNVGAGTYWKILDNFSDLAEAFTAPPSQLRPFFPDEAFRLLMDFRKFEEKSVLMERVYHNMEWVEKQGVILLDIEHSDYPQMLKEIPRSPPLLYIRGNPDCLNTPQVAMVGSRKPSPAGRVIAMDFAEDLAASGFTISSGLAIGVDTCAHQGALKAGGKTVAVLGTGIDQIYPRTNSRLADEIIAKGGALVSEFPIGVSPLPKNFPQRNRIISGLSGGVLVIEAAIKSGSLITARYANQQNREVFAVPGSINNPMAKGCHSLIKEGAKLVETSKDIVDELSGYLAYSGWQLNLLTNASDSLSSREDLRQQEGLVSCDKEKSVLDYLDFQATSVDLVSERSGLSVAEVMTCLLLLELKGWVLPMGDGYMRVK